MVHYTNSLQFSFYDNVRLLVNCSNTMLDDETVQGLQSPIRHYFNENVAHEMHILNELGTRKMILLKYIFI